MVVDHHPQRSRPCGKLGGDDAIRSAGIEISARMIVPDDHARGAELERPAQDFPRIERGVVDRSRRTDLCREKLVSRIQKEHRDLLPRRVGKQHAKVRDDGRIVREDWSALQTDLQAVQQRCPDGRQMSGCARPRRKHALQRTFIGGERLGRGAKGAEEKIGASSRILQRYRPEEVRQDGSTPRSASRRRWR